MAENFIRTISRNHFKENHGKILRFKYNGLLHEIIKTSNYEIQSLLKFQMVTFVVALIKFPSPPVKSILK